MASLPPAAPLRRSQRKKPIISYKNTVGANAPLTKMKLNFTAGSNLKQDTAISTESSGIQRSALTLLVEGDRLEVGSVCLFF
jgi:hypothetical protein